MEAIINFFTGTLNTVAWLYIFLPCTIVGGLYLTIRNRGIQFTRFGYAMKSGAMVRIDAFSSKLPEKAHCILDLVLYAVLFLPLTVGGTIECAKDAVMSTVTLETLSTGSWNAPIWPTKIVMTISLIILTLQGIAEIVGLIQRLRAVKGDGDK